VKKDERVQEKSKDILSPNAPETFRPTKKINLKCLEKMFFFKEVKVINEPKIEGQFTLFLQPKLKKKNICKTLGDLLGSGKPQQKI
jgi:hypothetical protein